MIAESKILELLNSLHEHVMARDVFVPCMKKMGLRGVKFTGGTDEEGIDVEYYELTEPESNKRYVAVLFKKGDLVYSGTGSKGSVQAAKTQAETAFNKEIHDIDTHNNFVVSRVVIAVTGVINERARRYIQKLRMKFVDRSIDYWDGSTLARYITEHWMEEFVEYFGDAATAQDDDDEVEWIIVDEEYMEEEHEELVDSCRAVFSSVGHWEKKVLMSILKCQDRSGQFDESVDFSAFLREIRTDEESLRDEFVNLTRLGYIGINDDEMGAEIYLAGEAERFEELIAAIDSELHEAEEEETSAFEIFKSLMK